MKYLKVVPVLFTLFLTGKINGQSIDSIKFNIYENYDSDNPSVAVDLNNLPSPTLFILDNKKLKVKRYSELNINKEKIESIVLIQNKEELKQLKYSNYKSVVILKSKR